MKLSNYYLPTLKEAPKDADTLSAKLMIRAGLIRKVASGLYEWLPLGLRVLKKSGKHRPRRNGPRRRQRSVAARRTAQRIMGRIRPLDLLRQRTPALYGPQRSGLLHFPHRRRSHHRFNPQGRIFLQTAARMPLSVRHQIPRRNPPPLRRNARARILYEGRLLLRRHRRIRQRMVPKNVRRVPTHFHALRVQF